MLASLVCTYVDYAMLQIARVLYRIEAYDYSLFKLPIFVDHQ